MDWTLDLDLDLGLDLELDNIQGLKKNFFTSNALPFSTTGATGFITVKFNSIRSHFVTRNVGIRTPDSIASFLYTTIPFISFSPISTFQFIL